MRGPCWLCGVKRLEFLLSCDAEVPKSVQLGLARPGLVFKVMLAKVWGMDKEDKRYDGNI